MLNILPTRISHPSTMVTNKPIASCGRNVPETLRNTAKHQTKINIIRMVHSSTTMVSHTMLNLLNCYNTLSRADSRAGNRSPPHDVLRLRERFALFTGSRFCSRSSSTCLESIQRSNWTLSSAAENTLQNPLVMYDRSLALVIRGKEYHPKVPTLYLTLKWRTHQL